MEPRMIEEAELSLATTDLEREIRLCCKNRQLYGCIYDPLIESAREMQPLSPLLHRIGKVPLEECYTVRIVKGRSVIHRTFMIDSADIVSCLLQLHRKHIRHGEITAQNVLINSELRARLCMPRELRIVDKRELADDIRQLGILVHCLVYSREPQYDDVRGID
ncbi:hypothetical protein WR25_11961 [Diploscapter pachys]|uniref:Protein kinase domain-containing protein n=1 Tax=Diploscapter pachys TaxID=2018661 RepID=A0A2A2L1V1_9BILA|nr:hypothetical protein WR25_11961 [Diploscapter pachys]